MSDPKEPAPFPVRPVRRPLSMKERSEATRRALLDAAEVVFAEQGFFRASVAEIVRRAGVAQGTFYIYFRAKEEIFRELVQTMSHDLRRELQEAVAPLVDRRQVERVGLETFLRFALKRRNLYTVVRECEVVDPELYRWYYTRLAEGWIRGLRQGIAREQIRPLHTEAVAFALMGAFQFVGMRWILWENRLPPQEAIDSLVTLILHGIDQGTPAGGGEGPVTTEQR